MISEARIKLLAEYFNFPIEDIRYFLSYEPSDNTKFGWVRFLLLQQIQSEGSRYIEYCFLSRKGRFMRLLDERTSSVDVREAAQYIDSVEPADEELDIIWNEHNPTKQFYLIKNYCPPLYCGRESN
jgi:hypothetical protein